MSVDGQDGPPMAVTTGLPQGSPVSPVLFGIYIADVHKAVENKVFGCKGISFVHDVTWFVEGTSIEEVTVGLESCAAESLICHGGGRCRCGSQARVKGVQAWRVSRRGRVWSGEYGRVLAA